jgi:hypothetical protein
LTKGLPHEIIKHDLNPTISSIRSQSKSLPTNLSTNLSTRVNRKKMAPKFNHALPKLSPQIKKIQINLILKICDVETLILLYTNEPDLDKILDNKTILNKLTKKHNLPARKINNFSDFVSEYDNKQYKNYDHSNKVCHLYHWLNSCQVNPA